MPYYEATVYYKGFHVIRLQAEDEDVARERATEIFVELGKGDLEMDNMDCLGVDLEQPDPAGKWDTDERV